jgi:hypothetical protein
MLDWTIGTMFEKHRRLTEVEKRRHRLPSAVRHIPVCLTDRKCLLLKLVKVRRPVEPSLGVANRHGPYENGTASCTPTLIVSRNWLYSNACVYDSTLCYCSCSMLTSLILVSSHLDGLRVGKSSYRLPPYRILLQMISRLICYTLVKSVYEDVLRKHAERSAMAVRCYKTGLQAMRIPLSMQIPSSGSWIQ